MADAELYAERGFGQRSLGQWSYGRNIDCRIYDSVNINHDHCAASFDGEFESEWIIR